ncbi:MULTISPECIES: type 1 glutamine amidotransferase [Halocynthiibacter]|uniref:Type 1 glutamine amidotransferase n=1 Tax=Halocynthiibacter halioticoli TaxID=2986804 RepID=A0AAE3LPV0_9RHOB|nr:MULTISPECIES: type 1 glutamine amidotransferase [Halocynthiibacter]MCV6823827.1 type 1 glutamine amidotransferase [Halocynthiibacter halioticoli]MCW4056828.1 type 1 glutamine amidotransferase [Halocynthiibacter sp. SDUM655004]
MKIGILECGEVHPDVRAEFGGFGDMFTKLLAPHGFDLKIYHAVGHDLPQSATEADGWLFTGSAHGVYEDHAFQPPLRELIREAYAQEVPMVGVCFGHQLIAQALGGKVEKFAGGWSIGKRHYHTNEGNTLTLNAWHQDQVIEPPADAETILSNDFCRFAGLRYGNRALSVQAHPEFSDPVLRAYLLAREDSDAYPQDMMRAAREAPFGHTDSALVAEQFAQFFRQSAAHRKARSTKAPLLT